MELAYNHTPLCEIFYMLVSSKEKSNWGLGQRPNISNKNKILDIRIKIRNSNPLTDPETIPTLSGQDDELSARGSQLPAFATRRKARPKKAFELENKGRETAKVLAKKTLFDDPEYSVAEFSSERSLFFNGK